MLPLRVVGDRVLIKPDIEDHALDQTASGLYVAESLAAAVDGEDKAASYTSGTIVALGNPERCNKCGRMAVDVRVGDRVTFSWKSGQEVEIDGTTYVVMKSADLLAVLEGVA